MYHNRYSFLSSPLDGQMSLCVLHEVLFLRTLLVPLLEAMSRALLEWNEDNIETIPDGITDYAELLFEYCRYRHTNKNGFPGEVNARELPGIYRGIANNLTMFEQKRQKYCTAMRNRLGETFGVSDPFFCTEFDEYCADLQMKASVIESIQKAATLP